MNTPQKILISCLLLGVSILSTTHAQPNDDTVNGSLGGTTGIITRDVECRNSFGLPVDPSFCTGTMPETRTGAICTLNNTHTYTRTSERGQCVETLSCQPLVVNSTNEQVCNGLTVATCASQPVCMAQSNGFGSQTTTNTCKDENGNVVANSFCPNPAPVIQNQTCNTYHRTATEWGTCNNNTQTRTVTCLDASNNIVDDSYCNQPKPTETQTGYCSSTSGANLYFWYKEEGQCDQGEIGGVCVGNGYTNQKVKRDGTLYERTDGEYFSIQNPNDPQTCYEYLLEPQGWRIGVFLCDGSGGGDLYGRNSYRDGCSIYPADQSCDVTATDNLSQIYQGAACHAVQVQSARRDTFVCKELSGDLSTTVDDSFCTYAPKPADIILSCDPGGQGNPNYQGGDGGYYDEGCEQQSSSGCDPDDRDRDPDTGQGDDQDQGQDQDGYDP